MTSSLIDHLNRLDRRWIFLAMGLAVTLPILLGISSDERSTPPVKRLFDHIESLPPGSKILISIDYDPNSTAELEPMTLAFTRHCCLKGHKIYLLTLWATGMPMVDSVIKTVVQSEFSTGDKTYRYGDDYVNLGFVPGYAVAISQLSSDIRKARPLDAQGKSLDVLPAMNGVESLKEMALIVNASGGFPGGKEWVQYASTPLGVPIGIGCTGVQSTQMFPYYPDQILGLVAGIRGAIAYEAMLAEKYPDPYAQYSKRPASRRGGPQRWAHRLMIALILLGNGIHVANRFRWRPRHAA